MHLKLEKTFPLVLDNPLPFQHSNIMLCFTSSPHNARLQLLEANASIQHSFRQCVLNKYLIYYLFVVIIIIYYLLLLITYYLQYNTIIKTYNTQKVASQLNLFCLIVYYLSIMYILHRGVTRQDNVPTTSRVRRRDLVHYSDT